MDRHLLLALCLYGALDLAAAGDVSLKNPGMALTKGKPAGWGYHDFKTGGKPLVSANGSHDGGSCVGVHVADPKQRGSWSQYVRLTGQPFLEVKGWYRTDEVKPDRNKGATVRMSYRGTGKVRFFGDHRFYLAPSPEWKQFGFIDRTIEGSDRLEVELFNFFAPGTVWFDDVTCSLGRAEDWLIPARARMDQPPRSNQVGYAPTDAETLTFTPPAFRCVPIRGVKRYRFQCSTDPKFAAAKTRAYESPLAIYTPHETLPPGEYWWRYGFAVDKAGLTVWSKARRFTIAPDPMPFPRPTAEQVAALIPNTRPRVFLTPELVKRIRSSDDPTIKEMMSNTLRSCKRYIAGPLYSEPPMLPKDRIARRNKYQEIFRTMRPFTSGMERCAFAYAVTGDKAAGAEAKRRLMHFMTWDPQGSSGVFHNDEPAMDLAKRGPRTFDWIHDLLTEEERKKCVEHFRLRLGDINRMHRRMPFETSPFSSHPGRMVPFVVEGSIVFYHDTPDAKDWLEYTLHLMWNTYPAWGSADGGWHEGPGYWGAYIGMMTRNVYGFGPLGKLWKKKPFFQNTGYFGLYGVPPYAKQKPFGDGHGGGTGAGHGDILYSLASLHDNPYFRWYAEVWGRRFSYGPERFMAYRPDLTPTPPVDLPQSRVFPNIGLVGMHSGLADPTGSVQMLFRSDPYGSVSHNHASQNAFAINAFGEALAISSGYYQQYGCPHHAQWTWETKAHNSITIDGKGQRKRSRASQGRIARFWEDGDITYAMGDATAAYEGRLERFHRHVVFLRPDTFVIVDDIAAAKPVSAEWWLHARSEMAIDKAKRTAAITSGDARLITRFVEPESLTFSQTDKFPVTPHKPDSPNQWHLTVVPTQKTAAPRFVTVLRPLRTDQKPGPFQVRPIKVNGFHGAEIGRASGRALAAVRVGTQAEGPARFSGMLTDATAVTLRRGADWKSLASFMVCAARQIELADRALLRSKEPISASVQYGRREARAVIEAKDATSCQLCLPAAYRTNRLPDGVQVLSRTGDEVSLRVPPGRCEIVFPMAPEKAVAPLKLHCRGQEKPQEVAPTVGSHITAWLTRTDGLAAGLQDVEVKYTAPKGSKMVLTAGQARHEWTAPGRAAVERFRWVLEPGKFPLTLINEHGLDERAQVESIRISEITTKAKLLPAKVDLAAAGVIKIEAEAFESHRGIRDAVRDKGRRAYACSGKLLYGMGDMVRRVDYIVNAPAAGAYTLAFRHTGDQDRTALSLELNAAAPCPAAGLFLFGKTGGWGYDAKNWRVHRLCDSAGKPAVLRLNAGENRLTLHGHGGRMHLDWIALVPAR